ncbi:hypothetical protein A7K94_0204375 [Modestobacter sp. VKM Ac-2676]|nr:hypothetical protein A7K94_0204375 [Modestobacter sp. VKM Ac-2676]
MTRAMPRARFLGQLGGADLGAVVASLDLFVHPGPDETFCQAVQESLAAGVPAVVAASGGPLDLVRHRENGWLWAGETRTCWPPSSPGCGIDPAALAAAAVRARPSVESRTWGRVGDALIEHLRRVRAPAALPR